MSTIMASADSLRVAPFADGCLHGTLLATAAAQRLRASQTNIIVVGIIDGTRMEFYIKAS